MKDLAEQVFDGRLRGIVDALQRRAIPGIPSELNQGHFKNQNAIGLEEGGGGAECLLEVRNMFEDGDCQYSVETTGIALLHAAVEESARDRPHARHGALLGHALIQLDAKTIVSLAQGLQGTTVGEGYDCFGIEL